MNTIKTIVKSKKAAIIISYLMILANTLSNLLLTSVYLKYLGVEMYGLYQMVYSVANYILIIDFGISTTMVRYISTYHAQKDYESEKNFIAHCLGIVAVIIAAVVIIGIVVNGALTDIYPSITAEEAPVAHAIFSIMVFTIALTIVEHFFQGFIMAYEHFSVVKAISLLKIVCKVILTLLMILSGWGIVSIALTDLIVSLASIAALAIYSFQIIKLKIKFTHFDRVLIASVASFMFAIFLQSVVSYVNNMVDKTILGIMTTKADVAIYSVALTFITLFNSLPSAISGVFLPQAARLVNKEQDREELTNFVVRPGRYQFMICSAVIAGFLLFGKEFITLWVGEDMLLAYQIALIIMIPNMIPLIENTVISILDAKKKRLFRSIVLFGISVINIIVSVVLVFQYGMMGAPIGTAFAFLVGYGVILNVYYDRVIGIHVIKMFKNIFSKIWICVILAAVVSMPLNWLFQGASWVTFLIKAVFFCVLYLALLYKFGFNQAEKKDVAAILRKVTRNRIG